MPQCAYINRILNMPQVLNMSMAGFLINMRAFHSVLNMLEYALTEL